MQRYLENPRKLTIKQNISKLPKTFLVFIRELKSQNNQVAWIPRMDRYIQRKTGCQKCVTMAQQEEDTTIVQAAKKKSAIFKKLLKAEYGITWQYKTPGSPR